jgi:exonuclease III
MTGHANALDNAAVRRKQHHNQKVALSPKLTTIISTYNVRTIKNPGKLHQLIHGSFIHSFREHEIEIVAIQEHRWQNNQQVNTHMELFSDGNTWRFDYCSATPEGQGGIGILKNNRIAKSLSSTEKISDRIMVANFTGIPATTIIIAYAPTEDKPGPEKDRFYDDLQKSAKDIPIHNILIIAGNFNARTVNQW